MEGRLAVHFVYRAGPITRGCPMPAPSQ
jgi:hypothetical protein